MERTWMLDYDPANCAVGAAVAILGERPTFLVLREAFNGVRRFADMQHRTGIPRQVLSDRLAHLVQEGLLRKVPYQDSGQRGRHEYRLTAKGLDLYPVLVGLMQWGDTYAGGPGRPPGVLRPVGGRAARPAGRAPPPRLRAARAPAAVLPGRARPGIRAGRHPRPRPGRPQDRLTRLGPGAARICRESLVASR